MTQTDQQNVPKLRFPGFEGEWQMIPLRDFVDPQRKVTYGIVQPGDFVEKGVPLVRGGDYSDGWVPFEVIKHVTPEIDAPYKRSKLKGGDLLMTIVGANTGTIAKVPDWLDGANITQTTARIAVDQTSSDSGYVLQCLQSHIGQNEVRKYIKGAAQPGLNLSDVGIFRVPAPKLPEQRRIASFLGAVDTKIAQLARKKSLLEDYKEGCMQKLFSQQIRFTDDDGKDFPDWLEKNLGELVKVSTGSSNREDSGDAGDYLFFDRSNDVRWSSRYLFDLKLSSLQGKEKTSRLVTSLVNLTYISARMRLRNLAQILPSSYNYWINWNRAHFLKFSVGSTMPSLRMSAFNKFPVALPHPDEQRKIADFLSALDRKIELVGKELEHAKTFKKGLLQQMFV